MIENYRGRKSNNILTPDKMSPIMHGLILSGVEYIKAGNPNILELHQGETIPEIKRAPGAHRIATHLREEGWDIEVVDFILGWTLDEFKELCKSRITKNTVFLGISRMFPNPSRLNYFVEHVKETYPHVTIIAGSRNLVSTADLHGCVDYFVTGYGEYGLTELLKKIMGKPAKCVIEEVTDEFGRVFHTVHSDKWNPAYPKKDLTIRYQDRDFIMPDEILSMELARGCIFKCKFCNFGVTGIKGDYTRSMSDLEFDLKNNYDKWGTTDYYLADETINDTTEKLERVAGVVRKLPFQTSFSGFMRGDLVAGRPQDWPLISEIGLNGHFYGIETFNNKAGRYVGKGMKTEILKQGLIDAKKYFLKNNAWHRTTISLIAGLPGETEESFWDGINWLDTQYNLGFPTCISANHLWVSAQRSALRTSYSQFEETWQDGDVFNDLTLDEVLRRYPDIDQESDSWKNYSKLNYTGVRWDHSTMDSWTAIDIISKLRQNLTSHNIAQSIGCWHDHDYVTTGIFSQSELMQRMEGLYSKSSLLVDSWHQFIADYKHKKLSI